MKTKIVILLCVLCVFAVMSSAAQAAVLCPGEPYPGEEIDAVPGAEAYLWERNESGAGWSTYSIGPETATAKFVPFGVTSVWFRVWTLIECDDGDGPAWYRSEDPSYGEVYEITPFPPNPGAVRRATAGGGS